MKQQNASQTRSMGNTVELKQQINMTGEIIEVTSMGNRVELKTDGTQTIMQNSRWGNTVELKKGEVGEVPQSMGNMVELKHHQAP
jgi:hypothetical protein